MADLRIRAPLLWAAGTVWPPVCAAVVALRFVARRSQNVSPGIDDWLVLPALVLIFGMAVMILIGTAEHALGYPTPPVPPGQSEATTTDPTQQLARKAYYVITILQTAALAFIKLSCTLFYRRLFRRGSSRRVDSFIWALIALVVIWGFGFVLSFTFSCASHFGDLFYDLESTVACPANLVQIDLSLSISDLIMDLILLVFPIPLLWRLQMRLAKKIAVSVVFLIGAGAIAMSITRLAIIIEELTAEFAVDADPDFVSTDALYFLYTEACFAIVAICLPTISSLVSSKALEVIIQGFNSAFSSRSRGSGNSKQSKGSKTSKGSAKMGISTGNDAVGAAASDLSGSASRAASESRPAPAEHKADIEMATLGTVPDT